jgi:hypothetical protein
MSVAFVVVIAIWVTFAIFIFREWALSKWEGE